MAEHPAVKAGHVAVVTGAASGIGLAVAKRLCDAGMRVVLADNDEIQLTGASGELRAQGLDVHPVRTDVADWLRSAHFATRARGWVQCRC